MPIPAGFQGVKEGELWLIVVSLSIRSRWEQLGWLSAPTPKATLRFSAPTAASNFAVIGLNSRAYAHLSALKANKDSAASPTSATSTATF